MILEELQVLITANTQRLRDEVDRVRGRVNELSSNTRNMTNNMNRMFSNLKRSLLALGLVKIIKDSINAASELEGALLGLASIVEGQGRSFNRAQRFINDYIDDGLVPLTNAVTAYKNLAARGYNDEQIEITMNRLKDAAAFGRQASYSLGDAVQTATEGLKNENSVLVDNAGVTKNVAKMWDEYAKSIGKNRNQLTQQEKIQAEVNGIIQETQFQVGDAAKYTDTYAGKVAALSKTLRDIKVNLGNAFMPIANIILPLLQSLANAVSRVTGIMAQFSKSLFGKATVVQNKATVDQSGAVAELGDATEKTAKQAQKAVAGFDEINTVSLDTGSGDASGGITIPETELSNIHSETEGLANEVPKHIEQMAERIKQALEPTIESLNRLKEALGSVKSFTYDGLVGFYDNFLKPVGSWTMNEGLPRFIDAISNGLQLINWSAINESLNNLWNALTPFSVNVGEGLLWLWENVLVPLGTWTMNEIVPRFFDLLAKTIKILNSVIEAFKPLGMWLLENFLQPLSQWTGGIIISALENLGNALQIIADWANNHGETIRNIVLGIAGAFGLWKTIEFANYVQYIGALSNTTGLEALKNTIMHLSTVAFASLKDALILTTNNMKNLIIASVDMIKRAGLLIIDIGKQTLALIANSAQWVWNKACILASSVAQGIMTAATSAWNIVAGIATTVTTGLSAAMTFLTGPIGLVIVAITAAIAIGVLLYKNWDEISIWIKDLWQGIKTKAEEIWNGIKTFFSNTWDSIKTKTEEVWGGIKTFVLDKWDGIKTGISNTKDKLVNAIKEPFNIAKNWISGIIEEAKDWGKNLIGNIVDGIKSMVGKVKNAVSEVANTIGDFLGFHSPSKKGPGAEADRWMPNLIDMLADGIEDNVYKVSGAVDVTANALKGIEPTNNSDSIASAVGSAIMAAMQFNNSQSSSQSSGDTILQLEGTTVARILGPILDQEKQRIGNNIVIQPI